MNVFKRKKWIPDKGKKKFWESPCYYTSVFDSAKGRNMDRPVHIVVGYDKGITDKGKALRMLADYYNKRENGFMGIATPVKKGVDEFYQEYLEAKRDGSPQKFIGKDAPRTFKSREKIINKNWLPFLKSKRINCVSQITTELVDSYFSDLNGRLTEATKNRKLAVLTNSFRYAKHKGYVKMNPLADYGRFREENEPGVEFSIAESEKLIELAPEDYKPIVIVENYAGLRRAEVKHLRRIDIDFDNDEIKIRRHDDFIPKNRRPRSIPLHPDLRQYLESMFAEQPGLKYVIDSGKNTPRFSIDTLTHKFKTLRERAGIEKGRLQDMRFTFISRLARESKNPKTVQEIAGHKALETTLKFYTAITSDDMHKAVSKLPSLSCLIPVKNKNKGVLTATNGTMGRKERVAISG